MYCPLVQKKPATKVLNPDSKALDTQEIPDLESSEKIKYVLLIDEEKRKSQKEKIQIQETWIEEKITEGRELGGDEQVLREKYRRACKDGLLLGDFILHSETGETIRVADILDDPDKWHEKRFADPLEPDYRSDKRIAYANLKSKGKAFIWSHAHGGRRFTLCRTLETIQVQTGERKRIVEKVLELATLDLSLFQRDRELVTVDKEGKIWPRQAEGILYYLDTLARWEKYNKKGEAIPIDAPKYIAQGVLQAQDSGLPELLGVITAPTLDLETDRVIEQDGYDHQSNLLLIFNSETWKGIPARPTRENVKEALKNLWKPFEAFPFVDKISRGVFLSILLSSFVRQSLPTAPGILINSPSAGSGKSLLARCLAIVSGETEPTAIPIPDSSRDANEEVRKSLLALGREGEKAIVFDNINGAFESSSLCAFMTSTLFQARILGVSQTSKVPTRSLIILTGNNVMLKGDLCRRILPCRIDPKMEKPWTRKFNLSPAFYCQENRLQMVADGLTIIRAGIQQGSKLDDRTASFELWSDTVRQTVCFIRDLSLLDVADPIEAIETAYQLDPETQKLASLLAAIYEIKKETRWKVAEIIEYAKKSQDTFETAKEKLLARTETGEIELAENLHEALLEIVGDASQLNSRRIGKWIEKQADRIANGLKFVRAGTKSRALLWAIKKP